LEKKRVGLCFFNPRPLEKKKDGSPMKDATFLGHDVSCKRDRQAYFKFYIGKDMLFICQWY
jgi:hypothetical protein